MEVAKYINSKDYEYEFTKQVMVTYYGKDHLKIANLVKALSIHLVAPT